MRHRVEAGESLYTLARRYGLRDWRAIYDHPGNAALWGRRDNPQVLHPGDVVQIPEAEAAALPLTLDCRTTLVRRAQDQQPLRLTLVQLDGTPMKNAEYRLTFSGGSRSGRTDGEGRLALELPVEVRDAKLGVGEHAWQLQVGHLNPLDQTDDLSGLQGRLANLGYFHGELDGRDGPELKQALSQFQLDHALPGTGRLDDATWCALNQRHDS